MIRKGQLVFEFIIAAVLFMGLVLFVLNMLNTNVSIFTGDYGIYDMENRVITLSEALVKTNVGIGLAEEWPVLDQTKITTLQTDCNDNNKYVDLLKSFNLDSRPQGFDRTYDYRIVINKTLPLGGGRVTILECNPPRGPPVNITGAHVRRYAVLDTNKERLDIDVWVW